MANFAATICGYCYFIRKLHAQGNASIVSNPKMHLKLIFVHAYERMQSSGQLNLDLFVDMHIKTKNKHCKFVLNGIKYKLLYNCRLILIKSVICQFRKWNIIFKTILLLRLNCDMYEDTSYAYAKTHVYYQFILSKNSMNL